MQNVLDAEAISYQVNEGVGAFYGPKIDFHIEDALKRNWQCGTIQLDFQLPERMDLTYVGDDGQKHRPVVIHRAIFGSMERFLGILIEHFGGAFPLWLAPIQVRILPISNHQYDAAIELKRTLWDKGIRVEVDDRKEKISYKIRDAQIRKIPYTFVVGDKEVSIGAVSVRKYGTGDIGVIETEVIVGNLLDEIHNKLV